MYYIFQIHLEQGLEMLKIFKEHANTSSLLDDFGFYEGRQKLLQERKLKQQFQKQVCCLHYYSIPS